MVHIQIFTSKTYVDDLLQLEYFIYLFLTTVYVLDRKKISAVIDNVYSCENIMIFMISIYSFFTVYEYLKIRLPRLFSLSVT